MTKITKYLTKVGTNAHRVLGLSSVVVASSIQPAEERWREIADDEYGSGA